MSHEELLPILLKIAREAGAVLMQHYSGEIAHRQKADHSPVTAADEQAEELILRRLREIAPQIPVIAEESCASGNLPDITNVPFFLVDPIDGTKEFISKNGEFTVNIALIENGVPVMGVVFAPAIERIFWGSNQGAFEQRSSSSTPTSIRVRKAPAAGMTAVASRSHRDSATDAFLSRFNVTKIVSAGSSLKFCLLAAGEADIYPRMGDTMEWDTAAGHAVLRAAGGRVTRTDGVTDLSYGNTINAYRNPHFIAWGDR